MASQWSDQQFHDLLKDMISRNKSIEKQLKRSRATIKSLEQKVEEQKVQSEKKDCLLIQKVESLEEHIKQLVLLWTSDPPSTTSSLPRQPKSSASESLQLCFKYEGNFSTCNFFTKINIEDVIPSLTVELCDYTGKRVEGGPEFSCKDLKVMFLVLDGNLKDDYTEDDLKNCIAMPRDYNGPLLKGKSEVSLNNNMSARVCGFSFTDISSKAGKNGKFRLGAQLINGDLFGCIARSAVSPPFQVKGSRLKTSQKHPTPSPEDKLYRLKNIGKNGEIQRRAKEHGVDTVMDFLQLYHTDESELLSCCYPNQNPESLAMKWKETVDNAKDCDLSKELYKYEYLDDASGDVILLKCDFQIESVTLKDEQPSQPYESLVGSQKETKVNMLRKAAYEYKKRGELRKVYDSTNQMTVRAGPGYPSKVGQTEQQPLAPPSNMDPNSGGPVENIYSNPAANHDNGQQDMDTSTSITTDVFRGTNQSEACGSMTETIADRSDSLGIEYGFPSEAFGCNTGLIANGHCSYDAIQGIEQGAYGPPSEAFGCMTEPIADGHDSRDACQGMEISTEQGADGLHLYYRSINAFEGEPLLSPVEDYSSMMAGNPDLWSIFPEGEASAQAPVAAPEQVPVAQQEDDQSYLREIQQDTTLNHGKRSRSW